MNDARETPVRRRPRLVRPRDAASLILLRGGGERLEVLVGRRSARAEFMPGVYVFPGGGVERADRLSWSVEAGAESLAPRLRQSARAALRETWEEVGVLVGRGAPPPDAAPAPPPAAPIERAYRAHGLVAAIDRLRYVGRAITPSYSSRRFNTRFFAGDGGDVFGEPRASAELDDAGWRPLRQDLLESLRDVTRFMLARALALRDGTACGPAPLFYWARNARRIGICREAGDSSATASANNRYLTWVTLTSRK
jgi:8-oxo-dGTP pyrophosphatase MutT (NUDIX family)